VNRTAYVICWFSVVAGVPTFNGAGIYSENAQRITVEGSNIPMDVFSASGSDFEEASANARDQCKQWRHLSWLLPHLAKQGG
jgi:hypothetical protein